MAQPSSMRGTCGRGHQAQPTSPSSFSRHLLRNVFTIAIINDCHHQQRWHRKSGNAWAAIPLVPRNYGNAVISAQSHTSRQFNYLWNNKFRAVPRPPGPQGPDPRLDSITPVPQKTLFPSNQKAKESAAIRRSAIHPRLWYNRAPKALEFQHSADGLRIDGWPRIYHVFISIWGNAPSPIPLLIIACDYYARVCLPSSYYLA